MENDEIASYLASLEREDCYRVDATLKESPHELTQRVFFTGANGAEQGPYVRKFIQRSSGMGSAYERIFKAQQAGRRFRFVPAIHECYRHDDLLVVVMEFVAGETLQDLVYRRDPSVQLARDVFPLLCDAAAELHESFDPPIIHRDLKPSNVMLTGDGLTIIDFGIAREFREGADTDTTQFGTRAFAPPEQFGFGQTTVRSDVYALGMMLYFCLTEKIPTAQVRDARFEVGNVPPHLRPVLARATDLAPSERFASAAELKTAFLEAMENAAGPAGAEGALPPVPSAGPEPGKGFHKAAAIAIGIVVLAIAGIVIATGAADEQAAPTEQATVASSTQEAGESNASAESNEAAGQEAAADMQIAAPQRNGFDPTTNISKTIAGVTFQIPGYFGARVNEDEGKTFYYAETGSSVSMIMTSEDTLKPRDGSDATEAAIASAKDSYLNGLVQSNEELFAEIVSKMDCQLAGFPARIVTIKGVVKELDITTKVVYFIDVDTAVGTAEVGSLVFGQTDNAQFDYSADFAKTIASATLARG